MQLLEEVCIMGKDPKYICQKQQSTIKLDPTPIGPSRVTNDASSDEDDDDDDETGSQRVMGKTEESSSAEQDV